MNDRNPKRSRPAASAFEGRSTVCEVPSSETLRKQLSIRSFFGRTRVVAPVAPGTPPSSPRKILDDVPPTAEAVIRGGPPPSPSPSAGASKEILDDHRGDGGNRAKKDRTNDDKKKRRRRWKQVYMDCGQKNWGQTICPKCGTLYVPGVAEDEKMHKQVCEQISLGVTWNSTSHCKVVVISRENAAAAAESSSPCKVVQIRPSEIKKHKSRLEKVLRVVERDLGMLAGSSSDAAIASDGGTTVFLCLRGNRVAGYLAVRSLSRAYRMLNLCERDTEPVPCALGVSVLWTHRAARKRGIARTLVTAARENAVFGMVVGRDQLAFSSPTEAGWEFAKRYCGNQEPLVFEFSSSAGISDDDAPKVERAKKKLLYNIITK